LPLLELLELDVQEGGGPQEPWSWLEEWSWLEDEDDPDPPLLPDFPLPDDPDDPDPPLFPDFPLLLEELSQEEEDQLLWEWGSQLGPSQLDEEEEELPPLFPDLPLDPPLFPDLPLDPPLFPDFPEEEEDDEEGIQTQLPW